jgi:hypothetical protein
MPADTTFRLFDGEGRKLSCLDTMVQSAKSTCEKEAASGGWSTSATCLMDKDSDGYWRNRRGSFVDDYGITDLFFKSFSQTYAETELKCLFYRRFASGYKIGVSGRYFWAEKCIEEFEKRTSPIWEFTGTAINKECKIVSEPVPASAICGSLVVDTLVSPISLDWKGSAASDARSSTIVDFKLSPEGSRGTATRTVSSMTEASCSGSGPLEERGSLRRRLRVLHRHRDGGMDLKRWRPLIATTTVD